MIYGLLLDHANMTLTTNSLKSPVQSHDG